MKKIVFTISVCAISGTMMLAQNKETAPRQGTAYPPSDKQSTKTAPAQRQGTEYPKQTVNPDGTVSGGQRSPNSAPAQGEVRSTAPSVEVQQVNTRKVPIQQTEAAGRGEQAAPPANNAQGVSAGGEVQQTVPAGRNGQQGDPSMGNSANNGAVQQTVPAGRGEQMANPANGNTNVNQTNADGSDMTDPSQKMEKATPENSQTEPIKSRHAITEKGIPSSRNKGDNAEKAAPTKNDPSVKPANQRNE